MSSPRRLGLLFAALILLTALLAGPAATAAQLSGGTTIYIVDGREQRFVFDPIDRRDGQLLSEEIFTGLGFTLSQNGETITLSRGEMQAVLTLGTPEAYIAGHLVHLTPVPVLIGDNLFLPVFLLPEFGYEVIADSGYMQIRDLARHLPRNDGLTEEEWKQLKQLLTLRAIVRASDASANLYADFTLLTPELVASQHFALTLRQRAEYLDLMRTSTLVLMRIGNGSGQAVSLRQDAVTLVDPHSGLQYDAREVRAHDGLTTQKIAGGALRSSLLVFPKVMPGSGSITLFSNTNPGNLGMLQVP